MQLIRQINDSLNFNTIDEPQSESRRLDRDADLLKYCIAGIEVQPCGSRRCRSPIYPVRCTLPLEYSHLAPFCAILGASSVLYRHTRVPIQTMRRRSASHSHALVGPRSRSTSSAAALHLTSGNLHKLICITPDG